MRPRVRKSMPRPLDLLAYFRQLLPPLLGANCCRPQRQKKRKRPDLREASNKESETGFNYSSDFNYSSLFYQLPITPFFTISLSLILLQSPQQTHGQLSLCVSK